VCVVPGGEEGGVLQLLHLLEAELNVHGVELASSADDFVRLTAKGNFRVLGKRFGKQTPLAAQAIAALESPALRAFEQGEPLAITVEGNSHLLAPDDLEILRHAAGDLVMSSDSGYFAGIDPAVTPALRREGLARELISRVQRMRKDAQFEVSDRIRVAIAGDEVLHSAVEEYRERIAAEVLATGISLGEDSLVGHNAVQDADLDGVGARIAITRESHQ
jgi:isoleucyl-tRNA synthetase